MRVSVKVTGLAILPILLAGCATQLDHRPAPITQMSGSALTAQEYAFARKLVRSEIIRDGAVVTSATVTVSSGEVIDPNIGKPCTSGRLLNIKLIGDFPNIVISPHVSRPGDPPSDTTVTVVLLTADAKTGHPCLVGVHTGKTTPEPGAISLPLN